MNDSNSLLTKSPDKKEEEKSTSQKTSFKKTLLATSLGISLATSITYTANSFAGNLDGIHINNSGQVGIGTDAPSSRLHVDGNMKVGNLSNNGGTNNPVKIKQNGQLAIRMEKTDTGDYWSVGQSSSKNFVFDFNNSRKAYINNTNGSYNVASDKQLKKDISQLDDVLSRVMQLQPVSFHYQDNSADTPKTIGFIAQDVERLFPGLVTDNTFQGGQVYKTLSYQSFGVLAIAAITEQQATINQLKADNQAMTDRLNKALTLLENNHQQLSAMQNKIDALESLAKQSPELPNNTAKDLIATSTH